MTKLFSRDVFLTITNISITQVCQISLSLYLQRLYTSTHRVRQLEEMCYKTKSHMPKEQEIITCNHVTDTLQKLFSAFISLMHFKSNELLSTGSTEAF